MKTEQFNHLQQRLRGKLGTAIADYQMIDEGEGIMVCLSGARDAYILLGLQSNTEQ